MENRPEERAELERRGLEALEHPERGEPTEPLHRLLALLRIWHYPSFDVHTAYLLLRPMDDARSAPLHLRRVIWDRTRDMMRFADPLEGMRQGFRAPPTLDVRDVSASKGSVGPALHAVLNAPLRLGPADHSVGLDGEQFGVETCGSMYAARLQWWSPTRGAWGAGPVVWQELVRAVARLRDELEAALA